MPEPSQEKAMHGSSNSIQEGQKTRIQLSKGKQSLNSPSERKSGKNKSSKSNIGSGNSSSSNTIVEKKIREGIDEQKKKFMGFMENVPKNGRKREIHSKLL